MELHALITHATLFFNLAKAKATDGSDHDARAALEGLRELLNLEHFDRKAAEQKAATPAAPPGTQG